MVENKDQMNDVNKRILEYIKSQISEEDLLVQLKVLPITKSGEKYFSSVERLNDIMEKLVNPK